MDVNLFSKFPHRVGRSEKSELTQSQNFMERLTRGAPQEPGFEKNRVKYDLNGNVLSEKRNLKKLMK
jgi:hypothetical protein